MSDGEVVSGIGYKALISMGQAVFDAIPVAIYVCAADGVLVRFNRVATQLWGRTPQLGDTEQRFCGSYRLYEPDGRPLPHAETPMAAVLKTGASAHDKEVVIERPDGSHIIALVNIEPLKDDSGRIRGAINCFRDITDRKKAESAVRAHNERLSALNRIAKTLSSNMDLQRIVELVTDSATQLSGAQFGAFFYNVTDQNGERYMLYALSGAPRAAFEKFGVPRNTEVFEPTFRGTAIVRSSDIRKDPRYGRNSPHRGMPKGHFPVVSYLAVPVVSRSGEVHGGLFFGHEQPGVFTEDCEQLVASIAAHAAIAIDNARLLQSESRRTDQQAALYLFTDRLQRAETQDEIYAAALDAILRALPCDRASILLFDDGGVMRFVAWRGLSDDYRRAVDGHSPWTPETKNATPICIANIDTADVSESLKATIRAEGIGALGFIPLVTSGKVVGKFMTYYGSSHSFTDAEIEIAVTIARQLGFSLERLRAERARQRAEAVLKAREAELEVVINRTPFMLARCSRDLKYRFVSQGYGAMLGRRPEDIAGKAIIDVVGEAGFKSIRPHIENALQGKRVEYESEVEFQGIGPRFLHVVYLPDVDEHGRVNGWIASILDLTERKRAESQRDALAAELSHRVKNTLATMQAVASQSLIGTNVDRAAREQFESRLMVLSDAHNILAKQSWAGGDIREVILAGLGCRSRLEQLSLDGPAFKLAPNAVVAIAMAVHELAANASQYGALSSPQGRVSITWEVRSSSPAALTLQWKETGGPRVASPQRRGFGSRLIERTLPIDLQGEAKLEYRADGLVCTIVSRLESCSGRPPATGS